MSGQSDLTHSEVARILKLVSDLDNLELQIECDGMKLHVVKGDALSISRIPLPNHRDETNVANPSSLLEMAKPQPEPERVASSARASQASRTVASNHLTISAPLMGTFYRAASPTEPPFVEIGSKVTADDSVGVIEVMKLFNEVKAGVSGTIVDILASNEEQVVEGSVLFVVSPD